MTSNDLSAHARAHGPRRMTTRSRDELFKEILAACKAKRIFDYELMELVCDYGHACAMETGDRWRAANSQRTTASAPNATGAQTETGSNP